MPGWATVANDGHESDPRDNGMQLSPVDRRRRFLKPKSCQRSLLTHVEYPAKAAPMRSVLRNRTLYKAEPCPDSFARNSGSRPPKSQLAADFGDIAEPVIGPQER